MNARHFLTGNECIGGGGDDGASVGQHRCSLARFISGMQELVTVRPDYLTRHE